MMRNPKIGREVIKLIEKEKSKNKNEERGRINIISLTICF